MGSLGRYQGSFDALNGALHSLLSELERLELVCQKRAHLPVLFTHAVAHSCSQQFEDSVSSTARTAATVAWQRC